MFIAEFGNDTVGVVDLSKRAVVTRLTGFSEPQGVVYVPAADILLVAGGGDGSLRAFRGADYSPAGRLDLKRDADNLRLDPAGDKAWVGSGAGMLTAVDPRSMTKRADIALGAHPEGFQIAPDGQHIYVNVPDSREIAVLDVAAAHQVASWKVPKAGGNFPMAVTADGRRVLAVYRAPARVMMFDAETGGVLADVPTCGDADDVFVDEGRGRVYVSCGSGAIDVFRRDAQTLAPLARIATRSGARTAYLDVAGDRFYVAVRAGFGAPAELWEFAPQ